jgi:transcription antitermination factor NusG
MGLTWREPCPDSALESAPWFALIVRHQHERSTHAALASRMLPSLVPTYKVRNRWSDRFKEIELPLFAGYVFCRFDLRQRTAVLTTPGVRSIVGFGGAPAPVDCAEIDAIETMMRSNLPIGPWPYLKPGDRVRVERGPLRGLEGTLLREKDRFRLVVGIELLQRSVAAELDPQMVTPCWS